jgi:hypothetical protein
MSDRVTVEATVANVNGIRVIRIAQIPTNYPVGERFRVTVEHIESGPLVFHTLCSTPIVDDELAGDRIVTPYPGWGVLDE